MKTRDSIFALILIASLLIFSFGCGEGNNNTGSVGVTNYHKGTSGIKMSFMQNAPPAEMYDGQQFPLTLEVTNVGAYTTTPYITLSGHDKNIILADWSYKSAGSIDGKSMDYPEGGYASIDSVANVRLPSGSQDYSTTLKATACYVYQTEAQALVCVDPDPSSNKNDVCSSKPVSLPDGQGGPVSITRVDPMPTKGTMIFKVTLKNVGGGDVILPSKVSSCMSRLSPPEMDVVEVTSAALGTQKMACTPSTIRLVNGVGTTNCKLTGLSGVSYNTNMMLSFKYGYVSSIQRQVTVRRI